MRVSRGGRQVVLAPDPNANDDLEDILSDMAATDDALGLDHVNRHKGLGARADSIFIR